MSDATVAQASEPRHGYGDAHAHGQGHQRGVNPRTAPAHRSAQPAPIDPEALAAPALEAVITQHARTFSFAARFMPPAQRRAVVVLYAFFRTLDDLVDEPSELSAPEIAAQLDAWRSWLTTGSKLPAQYTQLAAALARLIAEHAIPVGIFLDFLDGMAADLTPQSPCEFAQLRHYCYQVAGTVGIAMAHVLGATTDEALAAAEDLGIAMQLTNILRDVGGDLDAGRLYLPLDELARFRLSPEELLALHTRRVGPDDRFRALMREQIACAHAYYHRGMAGVWLIPPSGRLPILIAGRLYRRILAVIERQGYDVLRRRASTSALEKAQEAAVSLALDRLWRGGENHRLPLPDLAQLDIIRVNAVEVDMEIQGGQA
jgi:phytoene synthase